MNERSMCEQQNKDAPKRWIGPDAVLNPVDGGRDQQIGPPRLLLSFLSSFRSFLTTPCRGSCFPEQFDAAADDTHAFPGRLSHTMCRDFTGPSREILRICGCKIAHVRACPGGIPGDRLQANFRPVVV